MKFAIGMPAELGKWDFPKANGELGTTLQSMASYTFEWILGFMGILAVGAIIYSGIMYITSAGDATQAENAKKNLTWAIIGTVIIALSLTIVNFVQTVVK